MSGILQQGYSLGYVIAACANLGVGGSVNSWKIVFWIGAGLSIGVGLVRCLFPESKQFLEARAAGKGKVSASAFWKETKTMLAQEWKMCVYCIILMTWFNCESVRLVITRPQLALTHFQQTIVTRPKIATLPSCSPRRSLITAEPAVPVFS